MALTSDEKCEIIARDIQTPWGQRRIAKAMCGLGYDPPSRFETLVTPLYLRWDKVRNKHHVFHWFLRTFVGIDDRG